MLKKYIILIVLAAVMLTGFVPTTVYANEVDINSAQITIDPSTWVAVDGLGRTVNTYETVGGPRENKYVGIFYWDWFTSESQQKKIYNVTEIMNANPDTFEDALYDFDHPIWGNTSSGTSYFWDEPIFGYYISNDRYVARKHAELLADANVDVIIFDCTNGTFLWQEGYETIFEVFTEAKADGIDVPQVAFMLNFGPNENSKLELLNLYRHIYSKGKWQDLWFMWEGKPLIMAHPECLNTDRTTEAEISQFFTFRRNNAAYNAADSMIDQSQWGWLSIYPQTKFGIREDGSVEQMTVGVAQNASDNAMPVAMNDYKRLGVVYGRAYAKGDYSYSYTYQNKTVNVTKDMENAYFYGINFQQQWDYALSIDPDFIFVTGWNEWTAGRWKTEWGDVNSFPDQFNTYYSRDCEPSRGILKDHYYCQLVSNIRKFKGVSKPAIADQSTNVNKTIDINSSVDQWADVTHGYAHYAGIYSRDARGWERTKYETNTMRNDILLSKVAYDDNNVYFMVETTNDMTTPSDPAWMRLLIDTDPTDISNNWEGFEYIINRTSPTDGNAVVERSTGGWAFEQSGTATFSVSGKRLQIAVPREALGMSVGSDAPEFNFKWADNTRKDGTTEDTGDIMDFYQYGDVAPGGRFMFAFSTVAKEYNPPVVATDNNFSPIIWICAAAALVLIIAVVVVIVIISKKKAKTVVQ